MTVYLGELQYGTLCIADAVRQAAESPRPRKKKCVYGTATQERAHETAAWETHTYGAVQ